MGVTQKFLRIGAFRIAQVTGHYPRMEIRDSRTDETCRMRWFDTSADTGQIHSIRPERAAGPGQHYAIVDMVIEFVSDHRLIKSVK